MQARSLTFALLASLLLAACNAPTQARKETPQRPVLVAQVHYAPRVQQRVLPGIVKARIESDLAFRVPGKIAERFVDSGAIVKKGDALARLDDTDFRLQVDQAEADYSSAKGALAQTQAEEERIGTLKKQGWSAAADVDKARSAADQARGAFARAERAVTLARNAVTYTTLTADADGIVSAVLAEPGQVLAAGAAAMRLSHTGEREAAVAIPETLVDRVRSAPAHVGFWALPGVQMAATLRELSPNADPMTRTYLARYSLADAPPEVHLGMSLTVTLTDRVDNVARLPLGALFDEGGGPTLWVVDRASGALMQKPVHIAGYENESVLVVDGVDEGAEVVALGAHKLDAGQKVRIVQNLAGS
jgi:RND family efflux transporter MFP subunit